MKTCSICKKTFDNIEENFYKDRTNKDGHDHRCKHCSKTMKKVSYYYNGVTDTKYKDTPKFTCTQCELTLPLLKEFFTKRKASSTGYSKICKKCYNLNQKEYKRLKKLDQATRDQAKLEKEEIEMDKLYQKILDRVEETPGLDIEQIKLLPGKKYKIKIPRREGSTKDQYFYGTLIQDCKNHIVFKNKNGRCESFLKVDLLLEHEYKEVN